MLLAWLSSPGREIPWSCCHHWLVLNSTLSLQINFNFLCKRDAQCTRIIPCKSSIMVMFPLFRIYCIWIFGHFLWTFWHSLILGVTYRATHRGIGRNSPASPGLRNGGPSVVCRNIPGSATDNVHYDRNATRWSSWCSRPRQQISAGSGLRGGGSAPNRIKGWSLPRFCIMSWLTGSWPVAGRYRSHYLATRLSGPRQPPPTPQHQ